MAAGRPFNQPMSEAGVHLIRLHDLLAAAARRCRWPTVWPRVAVEVLGHAH